MSLPFAQPGRFNPYHWLRFSLPSRMRKPADFFYVSFSLSSAFLLLPLAMWLTYIGLDKAATAVLYATGFILLAMIGRFAGLTPLVAYSVHQACLLGLIFYTAADLGGVTSPVLAWLSIVPFLPFFTMSRRASYAWMLATSVLVWVLYQLQVSHWMSTPFNRSERELLLGAAMFSMMSLMQVVLVAAYDAFVAGTLRGMRRKSDRLAKLSDDLQQANSHKDKFLAMVSHDMRTPLNAIMGHLSLARDEAQLSEEGQEHLRGASDASQQLLAVINDLLDFSQIRSGKLALSPQVMHLPSMLERTFQTFSTQAHKRGLRYNIHLANNLPPWIRLDPFRLTQMLNNLLGNAIKFTPTGYVQLEAELDTNHNEPWLVIRVSDSGIGIAMEVHQHIFEPFVQIAHSQSLATVTDNMRGIGLGLSITHSLSQSFGGTLSVQSQVGQGSTFSLRFPLHITEPPTHTPSDVAPMLSVDDSAICLLVIDDNPVNRLLATTVLKRAFPQAVIDQASGGKEGLEMMMTRHYDLVLIDLIMPDLHGAEAVRRLRHQAAEPYRSVPIVALTASLAEDARLECIEAGINDIMPKPFDRATLIQQVRHYAIRKQQPPSAPV